MAEVKTSRNVIGQLYSEQLEVSCINGRYVKIQQGEDFVIIDVETWPNVLKHVAKELGIQPYELS